MRKKLYFLLPLLLLASCSKNSLETTSENISDNISDSIISSNTEVKERYVNLDIIEINDSHGYLYESSYDSNYNLANFSYYVNKRRNITNNNVVLVANGDMFQGTAFSNLSHGSSVIRSMNTLNFDMMGIGNHEFDWGLDEILKYFDGNEENVEANFPLINGNVCDTNLDKDLRVGETNLSDNILPWTILKKGDINVGLLSYIGDQTSSICANKFGSYYISCSGNNDLSFINRVKKDAKECKNSGADVIVLNIHEGNADSVNNLYYNNAFAQLKDDSGSYLIDAVINGHTHTKQSGYIARNNGTKLPVVQASANLNGVGEIKLTFDTELKKVSSVSADSYYLNSLVNTSDKDLNCQNVLDNEYNNIKDKVDEVYCTNYQYCSREVIGTYACNIMKYYASADVSFLNTGGIRNTLNQGDVTIEELYKIYPFDNNLVFVEILGSELKTWYNKNSSYYYFNSSFNSSQLDNNTYYKVVTIDYIYYSSYYSSVFKQDKLELVDNTICVRDLMVLDMKSKKSEGLYMATCTPTLPKR